MPYSDPERRRESQRKRQKDRVAKGLCRCGNPNEEGKVSCTECLLKKKKAIAAQRAARKADEKCPECGNETKENVYCPTCLEKARKYGKPEPKPKLTNDNIYGRSPNRPNF